MLQYFRLIKLAGLRSAAVFEDRELRLAVKFVLAAAVVVILFLVLLRLAPILAIFVIALFIVYCIAPLVNFLISKKFQPLFAAIGAAMIILLAMFLFFSLLVPGLIGEFQGLAAFLTTDVAEEIGGLITWLEEMDRRFDLQLSESFTEYYNNFMRQAPNNVEQFLKQLTALFSRAWIVLALAFLVFYLVQDLEKAKENLTLLFPQIYRKNIAHIIGIVDQKVGAYIRGTLLKSVFVGLLTWLGLTLLGMRFALLLGILAGALNIILYIGPVLAAVPALLLSIIPGSPNFFLVLLLYIVVQVLDGFVFTPVLLGKAVDLSPLTVVVVILIGGQLLGVPGIILAVPITAILKVLLLHYYIDKRKAPEH
jgi:predicted PurR-regulated permease PerM